MNTAQSTEEINIEHLTRQLSLIPMSTLGVPVTIIGCGAIGSFLALSLAKMGITDITVYDHDKVSVENMSNQFFRFKDIGVYKTLALQHLVRDFTGVTIKAHATKFTPTHMHGLKGILVVAVDTMAARRMVFEATASQYNSLSYMIDPRMSAEFFTQFCINPHEAKDRLTYSKNLFSDDDAVPTPCTAKSTVYTATLAAGVVVKTIKNIILKEPYPRQTHWDINKVENTLTMYT